jgi:hypothetical protein
VKLSVNFMIDATIIPHNDPDATYIAITVSNRGDAATTITNLGFQAYSSQWHRFRKKAGNMFIANNPSLTQPIPHFLEPGARWIGMCRQNDEINRLLDTGNSYVEVYAAHSSKPKAVRLKRQPQPGGKKIEAVEPPYT